MQPTFYPTPLSFSQPIESSGCWPTAFGCKLMLKRHQYSREHAVLLQCYQIPMALLLLVGFVSTTVSLSMHWPWTCFHNHHECSAINGTSVEHPPHQSSESLQKRKKKQCESQSWWLTYVFRAQISIFKDRS